jgi:hypothetical protein
MKISINKQRTDEFADRIRQKTRKGITTANADFITKHLGAHVDGNETTFLVWHPEFAKEKNVFIEFYLPSIDLIFDKPEQHCNVTYYRFETVCVNEFSLVVMDNLPVGNRDQFGAFYQFIIQKEKGEETVVLDPMAWSIPYGIHAPAEVYDINQVLADRKDKHYFEKLSEKFTGQETNRLQPSTNLLEIHTGTATMDGSLDSLAKRYKQIATALKNNEDLSPDEKNLIGFDGVELMPVDPVIEHPEQHVFWNPIQTPEENGSEITLHLRKPNIMNWGYDVVLFGCAAVNPSILSTGRPHELLDLIETLHTFPTGPIKVVLDVVYGHADNQALDLLPQECFAGPNIYGQNLDFKHPLLRSMILEMQRRKMNWGFDGIRVDSAHDFKYYVEEQDEVYYDDEFLKQMSDVEQNAAGINYKPWMIFEDGRPWPRTDWELACTYRVITEKQKHPYQWSPMIFAYNTPYDYTYWVSKWWRIQEHFDYGEKWISGYANHDTMRRGIQADPKTVNVNFLLGNSLKMVMINAYNNPSTTLLMNAFLPGVPMDFVQALGNTPWSFFRNTDTKFAIKIAAEEAYFTDWQITDVEYRNSRFFKKLKNLGFRNLEDLRRFAKSLLNFVKITDYNPENIVELINQTKPSFNPEEWTLDKLNDYAQAWMGDIYEYCNADMQADYMDSKKSDFNLQTRQYRLNNPWLNNNFQSFDSLKFREPVEGAVIYYGYRKNTEAGKEIVFIANMEGQSRQITPTSLDLPIENPDKWKVALATPSVRARKIDHPIRLSISQGILFEKSL